jgi:hypothetical protein
VKVRGYIGRRWMSNLAALDVETGHGEPNAEGLDASGVDARSSNRGD